MSGGSDFATSRCVLHDLSSHSPSFELTQELELLSDMDSHWVVRLRRNSRLQFQDSAFLSPRQLKSFVAQLRMCIVRKSCEAVLRDYDLALELSLRFDDRGRGILSLLLTGYLRPTDSSLPTTRTTLQIEDLPLEEGGVQKLYEWFRDWTQMLEPID